MSGRVRVLALVLLVLAGALALRQAGFLGTLRMGGASSTGLSVSGMRGRLAYIRDGNVWTYDLRTGAEQRLTQTGDVSSPSWSGTGTWVAYARAGTLWATRIDNSATVAVPGGDVPSSARWSPRSARLAYTSSDGSLSTFEPASRIRRQLVEPGNGAGPGLAWSTDGSRLAFERHQPVAPTVSNEGVWTIPSNGGTQQPVYVASGDYHLTLCCWNHSDRLLLFWQGPASPASAAEGLPLYFAQATSSQPAPLGLVTLLDRALIDATPTSDGFAIAAGLGRAITAPRELALADPVADARGRLTVTVNPLPLDPTLSAGMPAWAPRGQALAFSLGPSLTTTGGDLAASLVGRRIWLIETAALTNRLPNGQAGPAAQPAQVGQPNHAPGTPHPLLAAATVPANLSDEYPMWSRDGRTLLFVRRLSPTTAASSPQGLPQGVEVWVAAADGSLSQRVVAGLTDPGLGTDGLVDWSRLVAYFAG